MTERERRLIPRIYRPNGTIVDYPAISSDVAPAFGKNHTNGLHRLEGESGILVDRRTYRGNATRYYSPSNVLALLKWMQERPKKAARMGSNLEWHSWYKHLENKDLNAPGTEIVMDPKTEYRPGNGWKIVLEEAE